MLRALLLLVGFCLAACSSDYRLHPTSDEADQPHEILPDDSAIDIVLVVDYSCSMTDKQRTVQYGLSLNAEWLATTSIDYQLVLISADPDRDYFNDLTLSQTPGWEIANLFASAETMKAGQGESGFQASLNALYRHPGWFRPNARTLFFFVSDEEEQSTISAYEWESLWPFQFRVASLVGTMDVQTNCEAQPGLKYVEASDIAQSICDPGPWNIMLDLIQL